MTTEDERYRTSTQYRLWSYTPSSLLALRTSTNSLAADRVREAVRRSREARAVSSTETSDAERGRSVSAAPEGEVDCLTVEEELKLVRFYCRQTSQLGDHLKFPSDVKVYNAPLINMKSVLILFWQATAIQYIKRFYLTNSPMTYHPADILKTALYFSTKTENHYKSIVEFANVIGKTKAEDVLASEFLLTQALRFTFDVRHPFRALDGAVMELRALASGNVPAIPGGEEPVDLPQRLDNRAQHSYSKANDYLKTSAQLTDVYFHFTPSQIMMASLLLADKDLAEWYIRSKFPASVDPSGLMANKVMGVVEKCAEMMATVAPNSDASDVERKEVSALMKKLKRCRNPEKKDLTALQRAKRAGAGEDEKIVKKRKLEREQSAKEGENLFGPALKRS
ncbi:Cyclin CCL1 [Hyphodiscus hymeniophilus]|uniref:Cyclin CCL1 n=1 Tax=Hyphodiscus hymeniophilus TaxID=353542 RepID=A0A9P7AUG3_9HELO|nr:Cyclin CCL1 [Hyphodiscus hymeniophilus]